MPEETEGKIPYWVKDTLPEHTYFLSLFESADSAEEQIDLTRAEYIALKGHLAAWRGYIEKYTSEDATARVNELVKEMELRRGTGLPTPERQNVASYLIVAREFYRLCPEAIVAPEAEFDETLEKLAEGQ